MDISRDLVERAYLYLKNNVYHDNLNLFLKKRLAAFEDKDLDERFSNIADVINDKDWIFNVSFLSWCDEVSYNILPKEISIASSSVLDRRQGMFFSNVRDCDKYNALKINYFIDAPIELHIIDVLWCMWAGEALESDLSADCYSNRLSKSVSNVKENTEFNRYGELFLRYIDQYRKWRDGAISVATELSASGSNVALLSLDLKSYYYHVNLDYENIRSCVDGYYYDSVQYASFSNSLTDIIKVVHDKFRVVVYSQLATTHPEVKDNKYLPIGFSSSSIMSNWYLKEFDTEVAENVRPVYYGRYVDDILMVFKNPKVSGSNQVVNFIEHYLKDVIVPNSIGDGYKIANEDVCIPFQNNKSVLQYFDKQHSCAGLEMFKQGLEDRSSAFRFMSIDNMSRGLDKSAYDILYQDSNSSVRDVIGLVENEVQLSKYLSAHITAHRLCKLNERDVLIPELEKLFKGQSSLRLSRLWEKVYQYAVIIKDYKFIRRFHGYIAGELGKVEYHSEIDGCVSSVSEKIRQDLSEYNDLSLSLSIALLDVREPTFNLEDDFWGIGSAFASDRPCLESIVQCYSDIHTSAWQFRKSNLIRHHLVSWPLANYSEYSGDLTEDDKFIISYHVNISDDKIRFSPRFIHYDEWQLFKLPQSLMGKYELIDWFEKSNEEYSSRSLRETNIDVSLRSITEFDNASLVKSKFKVGSLQKPKEIKVAIANMKVSEADISAALRIDKTPNLSFARQKQLYEILNSALSESSDIVVFPEVSIPVSWLPFMVSFSRRYQIAIIFGLEHWVANGVAYNFIVESIPFKDNDKYNSCAVLVRQKNHYAPVEKNNIMDLRLTGNDDINKKAGYHSVSWRGMTFSTYNCFELSDITHRILFKSEIDVLFACVWNKDTNYYQHILESTVRDLHCYTVQSNTSQYGGSCVLRPSKTNNKTMLYVKGGDNSCVLTTKLSICALRDFQFKNSPGQNDGFKHLPPGFDSAQVPER